MKNIINQSSSILIDFASWTRHHSHGHTNDGACRNYGYKELTFNGNSFRLTSGNNKWGHHYGSNERCYWGVYAPGAQKLRFELLNNFKGNLDVSNMFTNGAQSITSLK